VAVEERSGRNNHRTWLVVALLGAALALAACGSPPGTLGPPEPAVYLEVLPDGCAVRRGEISSPEARDLTWVVLDRHDNPVLERSAEGETVYRHPVPGKYVVFLEGRLRGRRMRVSREVLTTCP